MTNRPADTVATSQQTTSSQSRTAPLQESGSAPPGRVLLLLSGIALAYTAVNLLLKGVAGQAPPTLISALRLLPLFLYSSAAVSIHPGLGSTMGRVKQPGSARAVAALALASLSSYMVGNTIFQIAISRSSVGISVPSSQGGVILTGMLLGLFVFKERVSWQRLFGAAAVISGIALLSSRAPQPGEEIGLGVLLAGAAGACWVLSTVALRYAYRNGFGSTEALWFNSGAGLVGLVSITLLWFGTAAWDVSAGIYGQTLLVGCFNAVALTCSAMALRHVQISLVNLFSAASVALSAAGGVIFYGEPWTVGIAAGLSLALFGLVISQVKKEAPRAT
jgi:drug/metabolite transporter (DMT)-like permease